ncbi:MAG: glycosyltransferase family 2 protein [Oscillospiraceae bacterium]|nr:glycosyltransferase family 2 protein [Oscillospiraceae bacterium]
MINIVLSSYNGEKYIEEQIESIFDSEYQEFRLFVFDDCSTDNTAGIVKELAGQYRDRLFLIENASNKGFCRNFLEGLMYTARSMPADYYAFCDQDDVWLENRLTVCMKRMKELEHQYSEDVPLLLFTDAVLTDGDLDSLGTTFFKAGRRNTRNMSFGRLLMENRCPGCTSFMNAALVEMLRGFDVRIRYHDWWVTLIAAAFGHVDCIDIPTILYRQHGSNEVGQSDFGSYVKSRSHNAVDTRKRLRQTIAQASAFYRFFGRRLSQENKRILREFIAIGTAKGFEKRRLILKNGFYKSGILRNLGLFYYI